MIKSKLKEISPTEFLVECEDEIESIKWVDTYTVTYIRVDFGAIQNLSSQKQLFENSEYNYSF